MQSSDSSSPGAAAPTAFPALRRLLAGAGVLALAVLLHLSPSGDWMSRGLYDAHQQLLAARSAFDGVLVVDLSEDALQAARPAAGSWPYRRDVFALAAQYLQEHGARAVVFDIVFADPREGDAELAAVVRDGGVVLAAGAQDPLAALPSGQPALNWRRLNRPSPDLLPVDSVDGLGVAALVTDADGVVRRAPILHQAGGQMLPSLAAAVLTAELGLQAEDSAQSGELRLGDARVPIDGQGRALLAYPRNLERLPQLGFDRLLEAALGKRADPELERVLAGRVVFIGSSALFSDRLQTPMGQLSGLVWTAVAHDAVERGAWLRQAPWVWQLGALLVVLLPLGFSAWRPEPDWRQDLGGAGVGLAVLLLGDVALYRGMGVAIDLVLPLCVVAFGLVAVAMRHAWWQRDQARVAHRQAARAEAASRAKTELFARISQELRTPLNALLGMAQLLSRSRLEPKQRRYVDVVESAGQSLRALIDGLLDLSGVEHTELTLEPVAFSLHAFLDEQMRVNRHLADGKGLALHLDVAPDVPAWVLGDRRRLGQVVSNLLGNAIKFTPVGRVGLRVWRDGLDARRLRFEVSDTGIGMDAQAQAQAFEPFVQGGPDIAARYGGAGLGLAICRRLVQLMEGQIELRSERGQGTQVEFDAVLPETSAVLPAASEPDWQGMGAPRLRVLLAEDDAHNRMMIEALLLEQGHETVSVPDGQSAIEALRGGRFDAVLMDMHMPVLDGLSAVRAIRRWEAESGAAHVPVLALTAATRDVDRRLAQEAGCNAFLAKPVARDDLLGALQRWAGGKKTAGSPGWDSATTSLDARLMVLGQSPHLELGEALHRLGGMRDLYHEVAQAAWGALRDWRGKWLEACTDPDPSVAYRCAHDLKSVAASVGAASLSQRAMRLEALVATGRPFMNGPEQAAVMEELDAVVSLLEQVYGKPGVLGAAGA